MRGGQRALAADRDQHVDAVVVERLHDLVEAGLQLVRVHPGGAEHRAALGQQTVVAVVVVELDTSVLEQATPAVLEPDHRGSVPRIPGPHHRANHSIQTRTVTATGEDSDAHAVNPPP